MALTCRKRCSAPEGSLSRGIWASVLFLLDRIEALDVPGLEVFDM